MKKYCFALLAFCASLLFEATQALAAVSTHGAQNSSSVALRLFFVISVAVAIWGLYRSKKERIVVFANLTDVLVTLSTFIIPLLIHVLCLFIGLPERVTLLLTAGPGLVILFYVIKATRAYNRSINANLLCFFHAFVTKYIVVGLYVLAMLFIFLYGGASKRKYERESTRLRRAQRNRAIGYGASTLIFAILAFFGLWTHGFVSLNSYLIGEWKDEGDADMESE